MKILKLYLALGLVFCFGSHANVLKAQSIDSLLKNAFDANPELKSMMLKFDAAAMKAEYVGQLNSPSLGIAKPILPVETRLGPQVLMVSASQMLPWFGTLNTKKDVALSMSKAVYENYSALKLDLEYRIRNAYLNLQYLAEKEKVLIKKKDILESYKSLALTKVESGKSTIADVLRIEVELEKLKTNISTLNQEVQIFVAQINKESRTEVSNPILITDSLFKWQLDTLSLDIYRERISSFHPLLKQLDALIEKSQNEQQLTKFSGKPQFSVGMDYGIVNERTDASPLNNGQDIFVPKLMISVPIFRKTFTHKIQEEQLIQESLEEEKKAIEDKMILMIKQFIIQIEMASLNYESAVIQFNKTEAALNVLMAQYASSGLNFDELLKLIHQMYDLEIKQLLDIKTVNNGILQINRVSNF